MSKYLVLLALILPVPAVAQVKVFYPYSEWEGWPDEYRSTYIAGSLDTLSTLIVGDQATAALHYNQCMRRAHDPA
jgi:hypothetical protein